MIQVTIGNNVKREKYVMSPNKTLREALEEAELDYSTGALHLDGSSVGAGDLNKTFAELGYDGTANHDKCFLINVVKADNANI